MRVLIHSIFILIAVLSILLAAIIGTTYRDVRPFAYLLTNPDGSRCSEFCLFGVMPGTRANKDMVSLMKTHPRFDPNVHHVRMIEWTKSATNNPPTRVISLELQRESPSLAEMLMLLGTPSRADVSYRNNEVGLSFIYVRENVSLSISYMLKTDDISHLGTKQDKMFIYLYPHDATSVALDLQNPEWLDFAASQPDLPYWK